MQAASALSDLEFADLAVEQNPAASRYKRFSNDLRLESVPAALWPELVTLREEMLRVSPLQGANHLQALQAATGANPLQGRFRMEHQGMKLRVQRRDTPYGPIFVARRIAAVLRELDDLGLPANLLPRLCDPEMRAGLLLLAGGPGAGKTTVACAMLLARLKSIGGFTWTAENPVEYDLQGPHGAGQCYQEEVGDDSEVKRVLMDTVRSGADTFYIGEIREEQGARAASLAAASGMLVVSTLHADNPQQAILKMGMLAGFDGLAQSLRGILTLRLDRQISAAQGARKVLNVQSYFVDGEPARMKIREGNMAAISAEMDTQKNRALSGFAPGKGFAPGTGFNGVMGNGTRG